MSGEVHLFTARKQPLTRYRDIHFEDAIKAKRPRWFNCSPFKLARCFHCRRRHRASNMTISVYYDISYVSCAPNVGCNAPKKRKQRRRA